MAHRRAEYTDCIDGVPVPAAGWDAQHGNTFVATTNRAPFGCLASGTRDNALDRHHILERAFTSGASVRRPRTIEWRVDAAWYK